MKNKFLIMRGPSGSGKSTLAKELHDKHVAEGYHTFWLSTDSLFMIDGVYKFDKDKLHENHTKTFADFCRISSSVYLKSGGYTPACIILDNTNITWWQFFHYALIAKKLDFEIEQHVPTTEWAFCVDELLKRNKHSTPIDTIKRMVKDWQSVEVVNERLKKL